MRPYFSYDAQSAFQDLGQSSISVLVTYPAGQEWYVIMDKKTATPLFEGDDAKEARTMADQFAAIADLAYLGQILESSDTQRYIDSSLDATVSEDGLPLIPPTMVNARTSIDFGTAFERAKEGNPQWNAWTEACCKALLPSRSRMLLLGYEQKTPVEDNGESSFNYRDVVVLARIDWGVTANGDQVPKAIEIQVLDERYDLNGTPLSRLLHDIQMSPKGDVWIEGEDEMNDWLETTSRMPLFRLHRKPEQSERIYAHEGGPVLEFLAKHRPWLVEKDDQGHPIPLRVVQVPAYENFDEAGLLRDQNFVAACFFGDQLERAERAKIIQLQQRQQFVQPAQTVPAGTFVKVAELDDGVVLEAMHDRKSQEGRDWLNYRLWVKGELVLDVHPGNPALYASRVAGLSPIDGPVDPANLVLSPRQVGSLLGLATSPPVGEEEEQGLPVRVVRFLESYCCENLQESARALEEGEATIEAGKFVLLKQETPSEELAP